MRVLVFGSSGHTGSYLVEKLLSENHEVIGVSRTKFPYFTANLNKFTDLVTDAVSPSVLNTIVNDFKFEAVVNFLSLSSVAKCAQTPDISETVNFKFAKELFDLVSRKAVRTNSEIQIVQASSSEMYGGHPFGTVINETTDLRPISVYGQHKTAAHSHLLKISETNPKLIANSLILFNHESPRRNPQFVSRKIVDSIFEMTHGNQEYLELGDIETMRDWGYAKEFADGIYEILRSKTSGDFVIGTGELHSIREFCEELFSIFETPAHERILVSNDSLKRLSNNNGLAGDTSKLFSKIGWQPQIKFAELIRILAKEKLATSRIS